MATTKSDDGFGRIEAHHLYTVAEFRRRLNWGDHAWRTARREGLPVRRIGKRAYVSGREAIEWIEFAGNKMGNQI